MDDAPALPTIFLIAHEVHDQGGMERVTAELIRHCHQRWHFVVVSRYVAEDIRPLVEWWPIRSPGSPFPVKYLAFWCAAGWRLRWAEHGIRHSLGAVVPNRVDLATVHFCHRAFVAQNGRLAGSDAPISRRINTAITRIMSLVAERWCYRPSRTGRLAAVSEGVAEECRRWYRRRDVVVTPNGVDLARFQPDALRREVARAELGYQANDFVALFVGGDWERKGLAIAIQALAGAPFVKLCVVGTGPIEQYRAVARTSGVEGRVRFIGPRSDTERWYAAADSFVFPSAYEAAPLVLYEAAAAGLPIVSTRVNGAVELIGDADCGILVRRTPDDVGQALNHLALNSEARDLMAQAALKAVAGQSWDQSARATERQYFEILASGRPLERGHTP